MHRDLQNVWSQPAASDERHDYVVDGVVDDCYVGWSRNKLPSVLIPCEGIPNSAAGRLASGCELRGHSSTVVRFMDSQWTGAAAALICTDPSLSETFSILSSEVMRQTRGNRNWRKILASVEEWQQLLAPRHRPTAEAELGLWAELWFVDRSAHIDRTLEGWRGPEGDPSDFFLDGQAAEVKASRNRGEHHVSLSQVDTAAGSCPSWLLSIWAIRDPDSGTSVASLADRILQRSQSAGAALKRLAQAGFTPLARDLYTTKFRLLDEPDWYPMDSVPRVRAADPGVTHLRYRVRLSEEKRAQADTVAGLWRHFCDQH